MGQEVPQLLPIDVSVGFMFFVRASFNEETAWKLARQATTQAFRPPSLVPCMTTHPPAKRKTGVTRQGRKSVFQIVRCPCFGTSRDSRAKQAGKE